MGYIIMAGDDTIFRIDRFGLPVALVGTMIATAVYVTSFLGERIGRIENGLAMLSNELKSQALMLERGMSQSQAVGWIMAFRAANPTLVVPDLIPK